MQVYIGSNVISSFAKKDVDGDIILSNKNVLIVSRDKPIISLRLNNSKQLLLFGRVHSLIKNGAPKKFTMSLDDNSLLKMMADTYQVDDIIDNIEGHYIGVLYDDGQLTIFSDRFNRKELFFLKRNDGLIASTSLKPIASHQNINSYDQTALANMLSVFGNYAPKQHTIYKDIRRLGVGEKINFVNNQLTLSSPSYKPNKIQSYGEEKLDEYADIFRSSVDVRSSNSINWVYMSSGWDSSAVLSVLCDLHGSSRIRAVTGRFKYSTTSGVNNDYEIERAKKITDYFSVPLDIIDIDYTADQYLDYWDEIRDDLRSLHLYALNNYNFFRLANHISQNGTKSDSVFNGETSDGSHNLGFSQFATILEHPDLGFREYSDKMASYLYGPSFFKLISNNQFSDDVIFKLLKSRKDDSILDNIQGLNERDWKYKYIASFFLSAHRIPFANISSDNILSSHGRENYQHEIYDTYFQGFADNVTPETLYSWILHLYNSFHWQGSTVRGMMTSPEYYNMQNSSPFWDSRMQGFLSSMPEEWGRGLDLNPTKYPLKCMLKNKVDYPVHLQTGPHSYLYDIDPSWSADADILYDSTGTPYFKELIKEHKYEDILDSDYFNLGYINNLSDNYCNGIVVKGQELSDLKNLISLCNVGWY